MKTRLKAFLLALLLLTAAPALAQNCQTNLPCQQVPWSLPQLPHLNSPTPIPTTFATSVSGFVPTSTGTVTPAPTATAAFDLGGLNESLATMQGVMAATPPALANNGSGLDLGGAGGQVIGYVIGLQNVHFGIFTPFVTFFFFVFFSFTGTKLLGILLPVISAFIGVIRKVVQLILDFLPG